MIKNEKLQAGNECLLERDFNKARSLFEEVLEDDQDNVCAVRGKMFCDLKISEIKEIKTKSIVEGKRVPYSRYAKSVPESYSGYFTKVKEYFELAEANKLIAELIVDNERKNNNDATMIAESSAKEAKRNLFAIHYVESHKRRITRPKIICLPDIVGLIAFVIFVPLTLIGCIIEPDMSLISRTCFFLFVLAALCLFAAPGFMDINMLVKSKSALKNADMHNDVEGETDKLRKQFEKNSDTLDASYFKIRDMDQKIMNRMT
jgi:hypothetical protein